MLIEESPLILAVLLAIQALGLASALAARLSTGCRGQRLCRCVFLLALAVMGVTTIGCVTLSPILWLPCGFTLPIMLLTVVWDFRGADAAGPA